MLRAHSCCETHKTRRRHGLRHSKVQQSSCLSHPYQRVFFITTFEHGSGAFVLTCCCYWVMVLMEDATGETSGYWYCGEVTQIRSLWMRLLEMEPRLFTRPPSTRCNCWNGSAQETREWKTSRTAQVEAVVRELGTQQATMTQAEVRSRGSLVHVKHVTKQNDLSGKQDRMEQWSTWSFKMRAYFAAHVTKLHYILSGLMDDRTMDTGRTRPVRDGLTRWRWMVTCWEPRAFFRVQRTVQAILVMTLYIPGTDVTQLLTVWTDQVEDYKQQYSNKTFGGFRSSCDPRAHVECDPMAAEIQAAVVCQVCGLREQSEKRLLVSRHQAE